jgi:hypothetical protein
MRTLPERHTCHSAAVPPEDVENHRPLLLLAANLRRPHRNHSLLESDHESASVVDDGRHASDDPTSDSRVLLGADAGNESMSQECNFQSDDTDKKRFVAVKIVEVICAK